MDRRPLGKTGLEAGLIGLGLFKLGRTEGAKYPRRYDLPSDDQAISLLETAAELGINLLDTAPAYGVSETRLGSLMRRLDWLGGRHHWIVATKVGEEFEEGASHYDFTPEATRRSVFRSLKRIGVSWLDVVLIHSNGEDCRILNEYGTLEVLQDLKREGVVRAVGMSTKTVEGGWQAIQRGADVLMVTLNPNDQEHIPLIGAASREGLGVLVKKVFASGHLANDEDSVRRCLEWVFSEGGSGIGSVLTGTSSPSHLSQNVKAISLCHAKQNTSAA